MADLSGKYNTPVPPARQAQYQQWRAALPSQLQSQRDYDLQGAFQNGTNADPRQHMTDDFKKPNHPTFSTQSKYNGVDGNVGGSWVDAPGLPARDPKNEDSKPAFYQPSATNQQYKSPTGLQQYFEDPRVGDTNVIPLPPLDVHPPQIPVQPVAPDAGYRGGLSARPDRKYYGQ